MSNNLDKLMLYFSIPLASSAPSPEITWPDYSHLLDNGDLNHKTIDGMKTDKHYREPMITMPWFASDQELRDIHLDSDGDWNVNGDYFRAITGAQLKAIYELYKGELNGWPCPLCFVGIDRNYALLHEPDWPNELADILLIS